MQPQPAFLLHKRPYRETSALVELLTLEHGRVRAVAQGVQRPGSRSRGRLQPFTPLHVTWVGEGELKRLRLMGSQPAAEAAKFTASDNERRAVAGLGIDPEQEVGTQKINIGD